MANQGLIPNLYCLPGLGADRRLFSGFKSDLVSVHYLDFIEPLEHENFSQYARRLSASIDLNHPFFLMGISLGGMLSTEIAHLIKPQGIIYLSAIKCSSEMRSWMRLGKHIPLPGFSLFKKMMPRARMYFKSDHDFDLFNIMLQNTSEKFGEWATEQVVNWEQVKPEVPYLHINGAKDELFPPSKIPDAKVIEGRHDLTLYAWPELNPMIETWLSEQIKR
jgi:hypothetical protein